MTPRELTLWRLRLRTLKRDITRAMGGDAAKPHLQAIDRLASAMAREPGDDEIFQEVSVQQLARAAHAVFDRAPYQRRKP